MSSRVRPKRGWVRAAGVAVTLVVALIAGGLATSPASAQDYPEGILPPGDWTEEQAAILLGMVEEAEQKLPAFSDSSTLEDLGFVDIGPVAPGGWSHYVNVGWIMDGEHILDPEYPESLVYRRSPTGEEELVAAMYFLPPEYRMDNIPEELAWMPGWHDHPELCSTDEGRVVGFITPGEGECPPGSRADGPPMMHVWIVDNECGHRFGGVGVGGVHCDVHGGPGGHDDEHDGHGGDAGGNGTPAPPATPVAGSPGFTG